MKTPEQQEKDSTILPSDDESAKWKRLHDQLAAAWREEVETLRHIVGRIGEDVGPRRIVGDLIKRVTELRVELNARKGDPVTRLHNLAHCLEQPLACGHPLTDWCENCETCGSCRDAAKAVPHV